MNKYKYILSASPRRPIQDQLQSDIKTFNKQLYEKVKKRKLNQEAIELVYNRILKKKDIELCKSLLKNKSLDIQTKNKLVIWNLQNKEVQLEQCLQLLEQCDVKIDKFVNWLMAQHLYFRLKQLLYTDKLEDAQRKMVFQYLIENKVDLDDIASKWYKTNKQQVELLLNYFIQRENIYGLSVLIDRRESQLIDNYITEVAFNKMIELVSDNAENAYHLKRVLQHGNLTSDEVDKIRQLCINTKNPKLVKQFFSLFTTQQKNEFILHFIQQKNIYFINSLHQYFTQEQLDLYAKALATFTGDELVALVNCKLYKDVEERLINELKSQFKYKDIGILLYKEMLSQSVSKKAFQMLWENGELQYLYLIIKKQEIELNPQQIQQWVQQVIEQQQFSCLYYFFEKHLLNQKQINDIFQYAYVQVSSLKGFKDFLKCLSQDQINNVIQHLINSKNVKALRFLEKNTEIPSQYSTKLQERRHNLFTGRKINKLSKQLLKIARLVG